jgi:diadenosine tetraphosphate (Ap4A) HIT family hydrolase
MADLAAAVAVVEHATRAAFGYDKINYLMLMMVDPDVHFHVLPRYGGERRFADLSFLDAGWPGPPDLGAAATLPPELRTRLVRHLRENWRHGG